jgi:hypothetical protein
MVATTLRYRSKAIADNVANNNALLYKMKQSGNMETYSGGRTIFETIMYQDSGNYKRYSDYDVLDVSARDVVDGAEFEMKLVAATASISGSEMLKNSGTNGVRNLIRAKVKAAETAITNGMADDVYSDGTADGGKQVGGLQLLVADTPTSGIVGGIDRAAFSFWQNISFDATTDGGAAATAANIQGYMNKVAMQLVRGRDKPNLIVADTNYYSLYLESLQNIQRITDEKMAGAGFSNLVYNGAGNACPVVLDGGSYSDATGYTGCPTNHMYFLNTDYLKLYTHEGRNFEEFGGERTSINQDATTRIIGWAGNMTVSAPRLQGVLKD